MYDVTEIVYDSNNYVVLDFETTNKDKGSALNPENSIVLTVYTAPSQSEGVEQGSVSVSKLRHKWGNEYGLAEVIKCIEEADFLVCQNAKFELQWLERAGLDLSMVRVFDTLIAEYVLNAGLAVKLGLGHIAERYGYPSKEPYVDLCMKGKVCPSQIPRPLLLKRCMYDVLVTEQIFLKQRDILKERGMLATLHTRCILTPALADIEKAGMALSKDRVNEVYESTLRDYNEAARQLQEMTGGINLNSPKQRGEYIYETLGIAEPTVKGKPDRTPAGGYKTDSDTILTLKGRTKEQKNFLTLYATYAKLNAKLTKSLNKYKECVDAGDLLHASFNQTRTKTQRLSSTGTKYSIQFQNQAREFKPLFCARDPDWLIAEIDGAQLEFRVAAFLGQDTTAVNDIIDGFDVHSYTAQVMTDSGQPTARQEAKAHTFKPLFGGKSGTKAEVTYYEAFREKYPGITGAQQRWIDEALATQQLRTITGLVFNYPGTRIDRRSGYVTNTTQICNYPVQSFATADIIPIALVYLWLELRRAGLRSFIVNTIHDSAIMEIHPDEVEQVREIATWCFTHAVYHFLKAVYDIEFNVPLGTGFKCGKHWTEGEEIVEAVDPPFEWKG